MAAWLIVLSLAAAPQSAAARRLAKEVVESFGREALERAEPRVLKLIESLGDDAAKALRRSGPAGVAVLERHGAPALGILSRYGDDGVRVLALEGARALELAGRHGDEVVGLMVRHPGIGRDLVEAFGSGAARLRLSADAAVDLARVAPLVKASGRGAEILGVVERFGDRSCAFLWRHKGVIFGGAVLAAFLHDPQPYLDGLKPLVADPLSEVARGAASGTNWTGVLLGLVVGGGVLLGLRWGRRRA